MHTNLIFSSGVHIWEVICPMGCAQIKFGVQCLSTGAYVFSEIHTTTPRFVTLILDMNRRKLTVRVNGEFKTDREVDLTSLGPFCPGVELEAEEDTVILNPYPRIQDFRQV
jgi:hypothetical protein